MSRCIYDLYPDFMPIATMVQQFNIKVNSKYKFHRVNVIVQCVQKEVSFFFKIYNQVTFRNLILNNAKTAPTSEVCTVVLWWWIRKCECGM